MKASSVGLETYVKELTKEQIEKLSREPIRGILKFREVMSREKNEIPFELIYSKEQREHVKCKIFPNGDYFGRAKKLIFTINDDYYKSLLESGMAEGARFFGAGKLYLYSKEKSSFLSRL